MNIDAFAYWNKVEIIALTLPGAVAGTSYGTPAFKAGDKLFARLREDGKTLVVYSDERDKWMKRQPAVFFITDHYKNHPMLLVDLAAVKKKDLEALLLASWKIRAPLKIQQQLK